jgi:hypothetical protein
MYRSRGFKVNNFLCDGEFEPLRGSIHDMGGQINVTSNNEHVGDIERYIRTIKERARSAYHLTPFKKIPVIMVQHLIGGCVFWLNAFPSDQGVIHTVSPRTIMTGKTIDYNKHCRLVFGAYAQVHEEHDNSMQARTTGAIALRPTGNEQGGFYFMSLTTGKALNRNHWHELPMPQDVIDRVHKLARHSYAMRDLVFQFNDSSPVDEDDESAADPDFDPEEADNESDDEYEPDEYVADDDLDDDLVADNDPEINVVNPEDIVGEPNEGGPEPLHAIDETAEDAVDAIPQPAEFDAGVINDEEIAGVAVEDADIAGVMANDAEPAEVGGTAGVTDVDAEPVEEVPDDEALNQRYGDRTHQYGLRPQKPRSYKHRHADLEDVIMTQLSLKKGLVTFGEDGAEAAIKELKQIHDRRVMTPKAAHMLTKDEKRRALQYLMYLKKK